ncbi:MAG: hypothetical protein ABI551_02725 [Polyangiaceae bacterium]
MNVKLPLVVASLLVAACGGTVSPAQDPTTTTGSELGASMQPVSATNSSNSAIGPTPASNDSPAQAITDGMTPTTAAVPGMAASSTGPTPSPAAKNVNTSGSSDSSPDAPSKK